MAFTIIFGEYWVACRQPQSNRLETLLSSAIRLIASPKSGAIGK
jgi:hypothetical protein